MEADDRAYEATAVFDALDIDLVVKVLSHTVFSPFFTALFPVFLYFQGAQWPDASLAASLAIFAVVSVIWFLNWSAQVYRNRRNPFAPPPRLDWSDQVVVVTGGASGIGELVANTLAVRGVTVAVLDVNPIVTENYNIAYYKCDVSKWEEVEGVAKMIKEDLGQPTMLVNNAGVVQGKLLLDLTPEDIQQTLSVNTLGHFWTLKAFLPAMIEAKKGHVVTVASIAGIAGMAQMTDYNASKAALISLNESLRYELDHQYHAPDIRTTLIVPGHVLTPLFSTVTISTNPLFRFFVPSLQPVTVAKAIIAALDDQQSRSVYLPFYANFVPLLPILPSYLRDFAQWLAGADYAMKDFVKKSGRRPDEGTTPADSREHSKGN